MNSQEQNQTNSGNSNEGGVKERNTAMAVVAYILFFVPLFSDAKSDHFVKYHVHQGFVLFLLFVAIRVLAWLMMSMFFTPFYQIISLLNLGWLILLIFGIVNALGGKEKPLPLIGQFASKFKF